MISRRMFVAAGASAALSACAALTPPAPPPPEKPVYPPLPAHYGAITDEPYPVPAVPEGIVPPHLWRQQVANPYPDQPVGTIIVDPSAGQLHLVESAETAMRYGAGTGADAYSWSGDARLQFWREWPVWKAPDSMIARRPEFAPYSVANGGMPPGPGNPLGARAFYLFQNGKDTLYRIHGACEPKYLGKAVSSGCIRLLDQDVIDLHRRARHGARVRVLPAVAPAAILGLY
ncbi:L,D-transpeptidase [Gemmobacter fulvus]|uniref:L,D-transpeptidase n=1 Tax=Gemmobacter fulvus TaxID=2840474 RepID=A0A975PA22_9RHOB|nr:L,D-transpeptidase [Gemmobacter fulvus]MBT9244709.1 L,D-transpeptidase [Gemmobacter fulvus]QWK91561.1 L,D-transpeptidase [Gemmobacter fulvus]